MSLRAFHVFFITLVFLFSTAGFVFSARMHVQEPEGFYLALGGFFFILSAALPIYGVWFLKKSKNLEKLAVLVMLGVIALHAQPLWACTVCYGDPQSNEAKGMKLAIFFLLGCIGFILASLATFFLVLRHRAKKYATKNEQQAA